MRLTDEQTTKLLEGIHPKRVQERDGMSYVEAYDIRATMNRVFGFAGWSLVETTPARMAYEQEVELRNGKPGFKVAYSAHLAIIIHTPDGDVTYAGSSVGESQMPDFKRGDAHDMALKTAESGALKRAATNLGDQFGLSLYDNGRTAPLVLKVIGFNTQPGQPGWKDPAASSPRSGAGGGAEDTPPPAAS